MKQILFTLAIAFTALTASAQKFKSVDDFITHLSTFENAEVVAMKGDEAKAATNQKMSLTQVIDLSECSDADKQIFIDNYEDVFENYTTLVRDNEDDGSVSHILTLSHKDGSDEFVVIDTADPVIVRARGKDLGNMMNMGSKKNKE